MNTAAAVGGGGILHLIGAAMKCVDLPPRFAPRMCLLAMAVLALVSMGAAACQSQGAKAPGTSSATSPAPATPPAPGPPAPSSAAPSELAGTSWRLVQIQSMDDKVVKPADRSNYTVAFAADGSVSMQVDCNRARGTWKSEGPNQVEFGPLAMTRAMCPPGSLHDRIAKDMEYVRSYIIKDRHLFLALMADGGIYEFEPTAAAGAPAR